MPVPVFIDTDCSFGGAGHEVDDAFALACAHVDDRIDIVGVSAVHGNAALDTVIERTTRVLARLGCAVDPVAGADVPAAREPRAGFPASTRSQTAVDVIADAALARPGEVTLIALGPLTTVAQLIHDRPEGAAALRDVVLMGGNYTEVSGRHDMPGEFNIWLDPEAADVVFTAGLPLRAVGLDVTRRVRLSRAVTTEWAVSDQPLLAEFGRTCTAWIDAIGARRTAGSPDRDSCALHDALAVAAVVDPGLFTWRDAAVRVASDDVTRGVTVADFGVVPAAPPPTCRVAVDIDAPRALEWITDRLHRACGAGSVGGEDRT